MFEPSPLVPNLNEMMEEYIEEEETVQATQAEIGHEGEIAEKDRAETKKPLEETKKRRRGTEEAGTKQNEGKASDWVSKLAYLA